MFKNLAVILCICLISVTVYASDYEGQYIFNEDKTMMVGNIDFPLPDGWVLPIVIFNVSDHVPEVTFEGINGDTYTDISVVPSDNSHGKYYGFVYTPASIDQLHSITVDGELFHFRD